jgi:Protein of unknown function (DUF3606)
MCGEQSRVGKPDRGRVAADEQDDEVRYLAEWYGLSEEQARELIVRVGYDTQRLDEAAEKLAA